MKSFRFFEFGTLRVNITDRLLQRGDETIPLTPKVMDMLLVLLENRGHVLTKDELMRTLWPDSFVEESSLTQNMSLLRRALAEAGDGKQYIETIPKRGYRFIGNVREYEDSGADILVNESTTTQMLIEEEIEDTALVPSAGTGDLQTTTRGSAFKISKALALALVLVLVLVSSLVYVLRKNRASSEALDLKRVAVLPFKIIGEQQDAEKLSLGMADALVIRLSKIDRPVVLPTSSTASYVGGGRDPISIGKELGVDAVIVGTLQREGDRMRVSAQLIRLSDGKTLWSNRFDESFRSAFAVQDSVANQVAEALVEHITKDFHQRLTTRLTESPEAYQAYVTGIYFWNRRTKEDLTKAIVQLDTAVRKDDSFALAHAILADCYYLSADGGHEILPRREALIRADSEANKALALDETIAEAHTVKGGLLVLYEDWAGADREFRRALELKPNYAVGHIRYGYFKFGNGNLNEAVQHMERAQELEPASPTSNSALGFMLAMARDNDRAINCFRRTLELQSDLINIRFNLVDSLVRSKRFEEALSEFEKVKTAEPMDMLAEKTYIYAVAGNRSKAAQLMAQLQKSASQQVIPYKWVVLYAAIGDRDKAFEWLEKINLGRFNKARLKYDPDLDPLRGDKRFEEFLARNKIEPAKPKSEN